MSVYRSDGWAAGGEGNGGGGDSDSCSLGGYDTIYAKKSAGWKLILGGQDLWDCSALRNHKVPAVVGGGACYEHLAGDRIKYVAYPDTTPSFTWAGFDGIATRWSFDRAAQFVSALADNYCGLNYFMIGGARIEEVPTPDGGRASEPAMWTYRATVTGPLGLHPGLTNAATKRRLGSAAGTRTTSNGYHETFLVGPHGHTLWFSSRNGDRAERTQFMGVAGSAAAAHRSADTVNIDC